MTAAFTNGGMQPSVEIRWIGCTAGPLQGRPSANSQDLPRWPGLNQGIGTAQRGKFYALGKGPTISRNADPILGNHEGKMGAAHGFTLRCPLSWRAAPKWTLFTIQGHEFPRLRLAAGEKLPLSDSRPGNQSSSGILAISRLGGLVKIELACEVCGSNSFALEHADSDTSAVECRDCGHEIGTLGELKEQVACSVLERALR